jgi:2-polyprenyl-6-hydroxyphenyl methylase / 3-demethylubiquinone-9 3-methyltransferase
VKAIRDPERAEISHLLAASPFGGRRVLEIGCGTGYLTERYAHLARSVAGIDPDTNSLRQAGDNLPDAIKNVSYLQASAINIPFPLQTFDIVLFASSL